MPRQHLIQGVGFDKEHQIQSTLQRHDRSKMGQELGTTEATGVHPIYRADAQQRQRK